MGQLSKQQLSPGAVFQAVGTNFAGPMWGSPSGREDKMEDRENSET